MGEAPYNDPPFANNPFSFLLAKTKQKLLKPICAWIFYLQKQRTRDPMFVSFIARHREPRSTNGYT